MSRSTIRIVKLGGSLLDWPELRNQFLQWLVTQSPAVNIVVVGGGEFAEEVRRLDEIHHLSPRDAHWLATETMKITARLLRALLPESCVIELFEELTTALPKQGIVIFDVLQFLREIEPTLPGERLPEDWTTTSDSIAARLASALNADELVLLKSASPENAAADIHQLAATGYVDAALPKIAAGLKHVRCVNLRNVGQAF